MRLFLVFAVILVGCGAPAVTLDEGCARFGEQCRLRDGLLGVCSETSDSECAEPPCLKCQGQH